MAGIDLAALRADTPVCEVLIHFDNAGAALMPDPVWRAVTGHLALEREVGGYEAERQAAGELAAFYGEVAGLLGAAPDEIAFAENATRAWDMVFYGLPLGAGDRVISHASDYASNFLGFLQQAKRRGIAVDLAPSDATGQIDVDGLARLIGPRTKAIAITHVPTQGGLANPVEAVGEVARAHGLFYLLDACQSAGQIALDVGRIGCDALSGTGRKFLRGPRGTGFLYVRRAAMAGIEPPFVDLHSAIWTGPDSYALAEGARRFETFEGNVAGKIGLARAVGYARAIGIEAIEARVTALAEALRAALGAVPGVSLHDLGARRCGIVTFRVLGEAPEATAARLRVRGVNVSVSAPAFAVIDFAARGLDGLVRASVHCYNSEDEVARFAAAVGERGAGRGRAA